MIFKEKKMKKSRNNKKWLFFISGLLLGFSIGISIFFIDKYLFFEKLHLYRTFDNLYFPKTVAEKTIPNETRIVVHDTIVKWVKVNSKPVDTSSLVEQNLENWDDDKNVEFSMLPEEIEEVVILDRMLNTRKIEIKIIQSQEDTSFTPPISTFDVQQWSTPIKNSITYQNTAGILRIKGMDINLIEIFFVQGNYYLYDGTHYYTIRENKGYEKLVNSNLMF